MPEYIKNDPELMKLINEKKNIAEEVVHFILKKIFDFLIS